MNKHERDHARRFREYEAHCLAALRADPSFRWPSFSEYEAGLGKPRAGADQVTPPRPDAAGFWQPIMRSLFGGTGPHAPASEARQDKPGAPGSVTAPKPETAADGHPGAAARAPDAFWSPIMRRVTAELAGGAVSGDGPARQAPAAERQERDGQGGTLDWRQIVEREAAPAGYVERYGPGRPRPGSDAAKAAA
jgi:hypothetical protein